MIFEFNILFNVIKTHLAGLSAIIDAGLIVYVIYLKREIGKCVSKKDLESLKEYISKLFLHEIKGIKEVHENFREAINQRISDLQITLLNEINRRV